MAGNKHGHQEPEVRLPDPNDPATLHEHKDINSKAIGRFGIGIVLLTIVSLALVLGAFKVFENLVGGPRPASDLKVDHRSLPSEPRLEETPEADLAKFHAAEQQLLDNYGWMDKHNGKVRLPIARAMELVVERAPAARPQAEVPAAIDVSVPTESGLGLKVQRAGGPLATEMAAIPASAAHADEHAAAKPTEVKK